MFDSLLIANRGEIARRIMRTARRLGVRTTAVHSDADADAAFVREADEAVRIGPAAPAESYLKIDAILEAAARTGAEAVHPGYGFLAENAGFARACAEAGLTFVGPSADAIALMGRKDEAKALMTKAGVPVVPGGIGEGAALRKAADEIGYPVLLKAVAGGGGRGMRQVARAEDFEAALASAKREAAAAFGDDRMLVEALIARPRHIEVQVFGDAAGNVIHLFERDCSVQRRHQKLIEEAPAPGMTKAMRAAACEAAVKAARAVGYVNAGTVEFIADASDGLSADKLYFMEMNTRLQVEHPVTEMITGLDLVELQLRVAAGENLPGQDEIVMRGHAVEARLCAEDPAAGWTPSAGRLEVFDLGAFARGDETEGARLRLDSAVEEGDGVPAEYDSLIAKAVAWAPDRNGALAAAAAGLRDAKIWPVATNAAFLARALADPDFKKGEFDTGFVPARPELLAAPLAPEDVAIAAAAMEAHAEAGDRAWAPLRDPWDVADGWRMNAPPRLWRFYEIAGARRDVELTPLGDGYRAVCGGRALEVHVVEWSDDGVFERARLKIGDTALEAALARLERGHVLFVEGAAWELRPPSLAALEEAAAEGDEIIAPMPGAVIDARAGAGDVVAAGQTIFILEAMKMEHALLAPRDGVLEEVRAAVGARVAQGDVLARVRAEDMERT